MSAEDCPKEKGHFDGDSFVGGVFFGLVFFLAAAFLPIMLTIDRHGNGNVVWRTDTGLVCKHDRFYPKADCAAIYRAFGPRVSELKEKP